MGAQLPLASVAASDSSKSGVWGLQEAIHVCGAMVLSHEHHLRCQAIELHEQISECWPYLKAVCGMRRLLAGLPPEVLGKTAECERYILQHHRQLLQQNPHSGALRQLSQRIDAAVRRAQQLHARSR